MTPAERIALGRKRIISILRRHGIATLRMLEQKISDAGPTPQRIDPHLLTQARSHLQRSGDLLTRLDAHRREWHYLPTTRIEIVEQRFQELSALHALTEARDLTMRIGQTAEIAVLKALQRSRSLFVGHFADLEDHDDSTLYSKHDPDAVNGIKIKGGKLDYVVFHADAGPMGVEVKNIREWIYPDRLIMKALLSKCVQVDAVPVIVAHRISYSTFSLLNDCGVIVHQFYNQMYPYAEAQLAERVRQKLTLGYFDVRVGNEPDPRMQRFFEISLPSIAKRARQKFDEQRKTVEAFCDNQLTYAQFATRVRGRDIEEYGEQEPEPEPPDLWE